MGDTRCTVQHCPNVDGKHVKGFKSDEEVMRGLLF